MPALLPSADQLPGDGRLLLAFSGGPDSVCLLARLMQDPPGRELLCIHVDHQLDPESLTRAKRAVELAERLGAACRVITVEVGAGPGPEASARRARYRALGDAMRSGDVLLTAHHADDQVETVVLRLLRGAGPEGLAGVSRQRRYRCGWLVRPLLDWSRGDIERFLADNMLEAIQDPANKLPAFDRNFLRQDVLPLLRRRWPGLDESVRRTARLCAGAAHMVHEMAENDLARAAREPMGLSLQPLVSRSAYRVAEVLRQWCIERQLHPPPGRQLECFVSQVLEAAGDRQPELRWSDGIIRRWQGQLWLDRPGRLPAEWHLDWDSRQPLALPGDLGTLEMTGNAGTALQLEVASGRPGERIDLFGHAHHQRVKQLMADRGVPPWQRQAWPRVRLDGKLAAVGDRWLDERFARLLEERAQRLVWTTDLPRT